MPIGFCLNYVKFWFSLEFICTRQDSFQGAPTKRKHMKSIWLKALILIRFVSNVALHWCTLDKYQIVKVSYWLGSSLIWMVLFPLYDANKDWKNEQNVKLLHICDTTELTWRK